MPTCELCDGESFYDQDGKYYCLNCGTQSQDMQVEVKQEMDYENTNATQKQQLSLKATNKKLGRKRKRKYPAGKNMLIVSKRLSTAHNIGKPWVAYEGYQCLIKAQVEALIKMGFDERLKDVVGQIWFYYLRLMGIAFCDNESETISFHINSGRCAKLGSLPMSVKKKRGLADDPSDQKSIQMNMGTSLKDEEFYDEDEPDFLQKTIKEEEELTNIANQYMSSSSSEDDEENPPKGCVGSILVDTGKKKNAKNILQRHTLCFCYIGLVWLNEPVCISDLVRWSCEGNLPYHKASEVFPEEMKVSFGDHKSFNYKEHPDVIKTARLTSKLLSKLGFNLQYTKDKCKIISASFIQDLEFSDSVRLVVWYLMDTLNISYDLKNIRLFPSIGCYLMAYIVVSVKLIYYLDGVSEYKDNIREDLLRKLNLTTVIPWKKWVTITMKKKKIKLYNGIPSCEDDLKYVHDLSVYSDYCSKDVFKSFNQRAPTASYYYPKCGWTAGFDEKAKEQYYTTFKAVADDLNEDKNLDEIKRVPTSFPCSVSHIGECIKGIQKNTDDVIDDDVISNPVVDVNMDTDSLEKDDVGYIFYTEQYNKKAWHDSYRYLLNVLASRIEVSVYVLQSSVQEMEILLFGESNEKYKDLIL